MHALTVDVEKLLRRNEPMSKHTYFGIGGPAKLYAEPSSEAELRALLEFFAGKREAIYILGGGTNLLVRDAGIDGLVISMKRVRTECEAGRDGARVRVGCGGTLAALVRKTAAAGLAGLEGLVGIPGTVGGAVFMNAGGRHGCIGDRVRSVTLMDRDGKLAEVPAGELEFGYRSSGIGERIILAAELELDRASPQELAREMESVRRSKLESQPMSEKSAGCVFKNPDDASAGALIDQLGLKGKRVGGAVVSEKHANFIVNTGGATAADVLELIEIIRERVMSEKGIPLELEVRVWGE